MIFEESSSTWNTVAAVLQGRGKGVFWGCPFFPFPQTSYFTSQQLITTISKCWFLYCRFNLEQFHFHLSHPCHPSINLFRPKTFPTKSTRRKKNVMWQQNHNKNRVLSQCNLNVDGIITALLPLQLAAAFFMFAYEAWTARLSLQRPSVEDLKIQPQQLKWQQQRWIGHIMTQNIQLFLSSRRTWNIMSKFWRAM